MTILKAVWVASTLLMLGCATETSNYEGTTVDFTSMVNGELARCEATGHTRAQCCDDHDIDPCPSVAITIPASPIVVGRR